MIVAKINSIENIQTSFKSKQKMQAEAQKIVETGLKENKNEKIKIPPKIQKYAQKILDYALKFLDTL